MISSDVECYLNKQLAIEYRHTERVLSSKSGTEMEMYSDRLSGVRH